MAAAFLSFVGMDAQGQSVEDDIVFIHHSCGNNWLSGGLKTQLLRQLFIDEVNDIYYGTKLDPDPGRSRSLGAVPGDSTNMNHWILWFNDYLEGIKRHGCADGRNAIVMFKSCYPLSNISSAGREPGDPFSASQTTANYKSVFRKHNDSNGVYSRNGKEYKPLERIFAENPDTLFIAVTAPPRHYGPSDATNDAEAQRARDFNNWLKNEWLPAYITANASNVAVFDWFDVLANPSDDPDHPNRLRQEYGGANGDSHPNSQANRHSAEVFSDFIQQTHSAWAVTSVLEWPLYLSIAGYL